MEEMEEMEGGEGEKKGDRHATHLKKASRGSEQLTNQSVGAGLHIISHAGFPCHVPMSMPRRRKELVPFASPAALAQPTHTCP